MVSSSRAAMFVSFALLSTVALPAGAVEDAEWVEENQWTGHIGCGISVENVAAAVCGISKGTAVEHPTDDFSLDFPVEEGLKTVILKVDWEPTADMVGQRLSLHFEDWHGCSTGCQWTHDWGDVQGGPGMTLRVDHDVTAQGLDWDDTINVEDVYRFRVFADDGVALEQSFTVTWYEFYGEKAPADFQIPA